MAQSQGLQGVSDPCAQRGNRRERGATMIEFSLVMPILLLIMIGIMEMGLAFKDILTVSHAAREGSRVGAFAGDDTTADCQIVQNIIAQLTGELDSIQDIEIYRADTDGDQILSQTNTWTYASGDPTDCTNSWTHTDLWPSPTRQTVYGPSQELDIIGVRIKMTRSWITGFPPFRGNYTINETNIIRMEPESFE